MNKEKKNEKEEGETNKETNKPKKKKCFFSFIFAPKRMDKDFPHIVTLSQHPPNHPPQSVLTIVHIIYIFKM